VDGAGNIYIADDWNCRIRKVNTVTGLISTVAGNGTPGYTGDGIAAISAELNIPASVAVDSTGNIFIADFQNNRIRKVSASTGLISTVVGNGTGGYNGDGIAATSAELNGPSGVAVDSAGNIYIADTNNQRIRKMSASTGLIGTVPVVATSVAVDSIGNIYFSGSNRIQKVSASVSGLSFASTAIGSTSSDSPQTVTLWNNGNTALTLPIPTSGNNPSIRRYASGGGILHSADQLRANSGRHYQRVVGSHRQQHERVQRHADNLARRDCYIDAGITDDHLHAAEFTRNLWRVANHAVGQRQLWSSSHL
jgi:sugar lactone lactonase YvrE